MGRIFMITLEGCVYSCKYCFTHLALLDDIISKSFHCGHGKAYLFDKHVTAEGTALVQQAEDAVSNYVILLLSFYDSFKCSGCAGTGLYNENNQAARQVYGICGRLFSKPYSLPQAAHPGIDLTVTVLTTGFWPSYKSFTSPLHLLSSSYDGKVMLWDLRTAEKSTTLDCGPRTICRRHIMTSSYLYECLWEALQQRIRMITCS
ncbi:hypothetical protein ERO13_A11G204900v2 [Gossypium hirsutum]|uniref:Uncharacterized protein isoform X2 n=1 Tax=Gossypium hirsutum TaxID=3635 RepID=A0ABM2Z5E2_GOSHI|nr:uncharacterized protein LOC107952007 isoform X2 [Gossypium hirsutum]XP_040937935.1 uncharacterized protein LOC107952007 isoform X2 [Gossypium hirsutum]KAG4175750.1 hypothetical protein ERO13_A11G204900v2 [Gossypium hirsutum]